MTGTPYYPPQVRRRHRRRIRRTILSTHLVLAILVGGGAFLAIDRLEDRIREGGVIDNLIAKPETSGPREPLNILILGSDSRDGDGNDIDGLTGGGQRADTTILLHISQDRETAYGISLPRDALVDRPDCPSDDDTVPGADSAMFNTAFALGGEQCAVRMVESLTNVFIDHYVTIDFGGFKEMVDAVDGVEVCIPEEVDDPSKGIFLEAGTQTVRGDTALDYVRERSRLSVTGDIGRMRRQQAFMASMANKVVSGETLSNPTRVYSFVGATLDALTVDEGLDSLDELAGLALQFSETGVDGIEFITVPVIDAPEDPGRLLWTEEADELWELVRNDEPLDGRFSRFAIGAGDDIEEGASAEPSLSATPSESASPSESPSFSESPSASPTDPFASVSPSPSESPSIAPPPTQEEIDADRRAAGLCT